MTLNELNDYAGQHEVIAENLTSQIISELSRYLQDLKTERKTVSSPLSRFFLNYFFPPLHPPDKARRRRKKRSVGDFASLFISLDVSRKLSE